MAGSGVLVRDPASARGGCSLRRCLPPGGPDSPFDLQPTRPALDAYAGIFARTADGIRETGGFGDPEQWRFDGERSFTRDEWLDQMPTSGALTRLPPGKLAEVLEGTGAAIDAMGSSLAMPYATVTITAARPGPDRADLGG